jgi:hypothetical protein
VDVSLAAGVARGVLAGFMGVVFVEAVARAFFLAAARRLRAADVFLDTKMPPDRYPAVRGWDRSR